MIPGPADFLAPVLETVAQKKGRAFTWDNVEHVAMQGAISLGAWLLGAPPGAAWYAGLIAGALREATQIQANHHKDDIRKGWDQLFNPATDHFAEWFYPACANAVPWAIVKFLQ